MNNYSKSSKFEIVKFLMAGTLNAVLTMSIYIGIVLLGAPYIIANTLSWVVGILFAYCLNSFIVFGYPHSNKRLYIFCMSYLLGYTASTIMLIILIELNHFNSINAQFIVVPLIALLNYVVSKYFIFNDLRI